ncbi:glycogen synthase [Spirochaetia bacterium]|nr:glycogen synthase [Spirochaetia bacterium]
MKILMAASEAVPLAASGGMADVVSALSLALAAAGHDVRIVIPRYYHIDRKKLTKLEGPMGVSVGGHEEWCAVYTTVLTGSDADHPVQVYCIDHEQFFGRDGLYGTPSEPDFLDNPLRFTFFSRSIFQLCRKIDWYPDILHVHDWQTASAAVFLKYGERQGPFAGTHSVLTIHNIGYQGIYSKNNYYYTNLDWNVFWDAGFADGNMMNLLKAGICSADRINTVSPTYAAETMTPAYGYRLDGVLRNRSNDYSGILNGIDGNVWNPATDTFIPSHYSRETISKKWANKAALQEKFSLPVDPEIPLIGMVTRLAEQKGVGELFGPAYGSAWSICRDMNLQLLILGKGELWCEEELRSLSSRLPNFRACIAFDRSCEHLIQAGSDFLLMPSRYEPCGLAQIYALVYGTIPIVRNTGGLHDTVENFDQNAGTGTGFMFDDLTPSAIYNTVGWANWAYYNRREQIESMRLIGMEKDFSWSKSAGEYLKLYEGIWS